MRLTPDEYRQGLIKWNPRSHAEVRTQTANDETTESTWSEPLSDANGSKVQSPPGQFIQISHRLLGGSEPPFHIRWDRLDVSGAVCTVVLDPSPHSGQPIKFAHIPNYGIFHRLVVEVPETLAWASDTVLRVDDVIVRLVTGPITGEKSGALNIVEATPGGFTLTSGWSGTVHREGRFIEIVAPGEDEAAAELNANSILGLLALVLGSSAVGEVVFSEPYSAAPGKPQSGKFRHAITKKLPSAVEEVGLDAVDRVLSSLLDATRMMRTLRLSLHWFERGIRAQTALDELICYFVAIDAIVTTFASTHGPIPYIRERQDSVGPKLKSLLKGEVDSAMMGRLLGSLGYASLNDRFAFYVMTRGLDHPSVGKFEDLARARNQVLHGDTTGVTPEIAADTGELVVAILKKELDLNLNLPWERGPKLISVTTPWIYQGYGFQSEESRREALTPDVDQTQLG
jgi:hypothetical protein